MSESWTMNFTARKYNPGFLSEEELVASFCVRTNEFESLIEMLRECAGSSNPHQLVIGPRGSGKTSLLLRVVAEIRRDAALSSRFFPVVFAEESYEVSTAGEFWLECLSRLALQAPRRESDPDLQRTYDELRGISDDRTLGERCLGALLDFSDRHDKRLVLFVENLNMMFRDMSDPDAGWRLRKILQTEPRIVLLASATSRFEQIDNPDQALYDLFRTTALRPLETEECSVLWENVSGRPSRQGTIRSLRILTGGNPRLFVIAARFGAGISFRELMADLLDLVDDHTEYFRSHLESLPPQERRVYLGLADLWKPATTKEIAERTRLDTSKCSALLARLAERGVVEVAGGTSRRKQYYLTERMYNIYYLMRRPRGTDRLVDALIRFMESFYSPPELRDIGIRIAREVKNIDGEMRLLHETAFKRLLALPLMVEHRSELLDMFPVDVPVVTTPNSILPVGTNAEHSRMETIPSRDTPARHEPDGYQETAGRKLLDRGVEFLAQKRLEGAREIFDQVIRLYGDSPKPDLIDLTAKALIGKGGVYLEMELFDEALEACEGIVRRYGATYETAAHEASANILIRQGTALGGQDRPQHALAVFEEVVRRFGASEEPALVGLVASAMFNKGVSLDALNLAEEAAATYDEVARRFGASKQPEVLGTVGKALYNQGNVLGALGRLEEADEVYSEIVRRFQTSEEPGLVEIVTKSLIDKGYTLSALGRPEDALEAYDEAIIHPGESEKSSIPGLIARAVVHKGFILIKLGRAEEALASYKEAICRFEAHGEVRKPELIAQVFVEKGFALINLNRFAEAVGACDEAIRRIGDSEEPVMVYLAADASYTKGCALLAQNRPSDALCVFDEVLRCLPIIDSTLIPMLEAKTIMSRGIALDWLNRPEEALIAYEEVVRRLGESSDPIVSGPVVTALERMIPILDNADRRQEARAAHQELARRVGDDALTYDELIERSLLERADCELLLGRLETAIEAAALALEKCLPESVENRLRARFILATATLAVDDLSRCEREIEAILEGLPHLGNLPKEFLQALMTFSIELGTARMREFIEVSASAEILLPLVTALAQEVGDRPRVAREVEEVAEDIRKELESMKSNSGAGNLRMI